jgi:DNA-binding CsgD family transcriptional regulator
VSSTGILVKGAAVTEHVQPYRVPFPQPSLELAIADLQPPPEPLEPLDDELAQFAASLDAAALDPTLWVDLLKQLAKMFDSTCAHVALFDYASGRHLLHAIASEQFDIPYPVLEAYEQVAYLDPRAGLCLNFPNRTITHEDIDPEKLAQLPVVQMAPDELAQMMTLNDIEEPYWGFLSVLRHKNAPKFTRLERARMTGLAQALTRSMRLYRETELQAREGRRIQLDMLEHLSFPAGLFTEDGICVGLNPTARERVGVGLSADWALPFGWTSLCREAAQTGLMEVEVATPTGQAPARLTRLSGVHPLLLLEMDIDPHNTIVRVDRFCSLHGLTNAERAVVQLLSLGNGLNRIAEIRKTSLETVRTQIRIVREKTGLRTQSELMAAISGFDRSAS